MRFLIIWYLAITGLAIHAQSKSGEPGPVTIEHKLAFEKDTNYVSPFYPAFNDTIRAILKQKNMNASGNYTADWRISPYGLFLCLITQNDTVAPPIFQGRIFARWISGEIICTIGKPLLHGADSAATTRYRIFTFKEGLLERDERIKPKDHKYVVNLKKEQLSEFVVDTPLNIALQELYIQTPDIPEQFKIFNNSLTDYSLASVKARFLFIIDSLNKAFKLQPLRSYLSVPQARAISISMNVKLIRRAMQEMDADISYTQFVKRYCNKKVLGEVIVARYMYRNEQDKQVVRYELAIDGNSDEGAYVINKNVTRIHQNYKHKWVYEYCPDYSWSRKELNILYFNEDIVQKPLPARYAEMLSYYDFMKTGLKLSPQESDSLSKYGISSDMLTPTTKELDEIGVPLNNSELFFAAFFRHDFNWDSGSQGLFPRLSLQETEQMYLQIIANKELDDYSRAKMFSNYESFDHHEDQKYGKHITKMKKVAYKYLPAYLAKMLL